MGWEGRQDLYRLAALLSELQRILNPLPRGSAGDFRVEMVPPPPLPPTGIPGFAAGQPAGRAPARTAVEWASLAPGRPPPRAPLPMPPWIEPPPVPQSPVAEPEAAAPEQRDGETPEGAGGSAAARMPGPVASPTALPEAPPTPSRSGSVPPPTRSAGSESKPARLSPLIARGAPQAEITPEPDRRVEAFPRIAVPRTTSHAPDAAREIANAAPSYAAARPAHPVAPPLRESAAPPVTTAPVAGDRDRRPLPAAVRLPRDLAPAMSPVGRVPPPVRPAAGPVPGNRPPPPQWPPRSSHAWAYPPPATGEPITIDVPRLDAPMVEAPADVSPSEPPPAETPDVGAEGTAPAPLSEPGRRFLVWRGRILGGVPLELRDAARTRFERRFVPRLALRLP